MYPQSGWERKNNKFSKDCIQSDGRLKNIYLLCGGFLKTGVPVSPSAE
jgi:hypothetical protein